MVTFSGPCCAHEGAIKRRKIAARKTEAKILRLRGWGSKCPEELKYLRLIVMGGFAGRCHSAAILPSGPPVPMTISHNLRRAGSRVFRLHHAQRLVHSSPSGSGSVSIST